MMVSRGASDENRAKARKHRFAFPILLQKGWGMSKRYGLLAAPVAYLLDDTGVVVREPAVGPGPIRRLLEELGH